jgi:pimeloyl-ACP methyl ester carboxylesterase
VNLVQESGSFPPRSVGDANEPSGSRVPPVPASDVHARYLSINGIRTHYLEAGRGEPIVLLHSGEYGGRAEFSWEYMIPALAARYRVIAPDWLGFGLTEKIHDFGGKRRRMMLHMSSLLEVLDIGTAHFAGNSMGAGNLLMMASEADYRINPRSITLISGGGFAPDNEARRATLEYDCTREAMQRLLQAIFHHPKWWTDEAYVDRRQEAATAPGAWEAVAVARFQSPLRRPRSDFGQPDRTRYEDIRCPALFIAASNDRLRKSGYADEPARRVRAARVETVTNSGHCPNIERAGDVSDLLLDFISAL